MIRRGKGVGINGNTRGVDPLGLPQPEKHPAEQVVPHTRHVSDARALPRGRDREVRGIATKALQIMLAVAIGLIEFDHRLADGDDVSHRRTSFAFLASP